MPDAPGSPTSREHQPPDHDPPKKGPAARREAKKVFLAALRITQNVHKSCKKAGRSRDWMYDQRKLDPKFRARWDDIVRHRDAMLEDTTYSLAINGMSVPLVSEGAIIGYWQKFFPKLNTDLLRVTNPSKYHRSPIPAEELTTVSDADERAAAVRDRLRQMEASIQPPPPPEPPPTPPPDLEAPTA